MFTTFAQPDQAAAPAIIWHDHHGDGRPVAAHVLVKVRFRGESIDDAESFPPVQAGLYDWHQPVSRRDIIAWRYARLEDAPLSHRILAEAEPWLAGMDTPFMRRFIFGSLILAAAMFVALLVQVNL